MPHKESLRAVVELRDASDRAAPAKSKPSTESEMTLSMFWRRISNEGKRNDVISPRCVDASAQLGIHSCSFGLVNCYTKSWNETGEQRHLEILIRSISFGPPLPTGRQPPCLMEHRTSQPLEASQSWINR